MTRPPKYGMTNKKVGIVVPTWIYEKTKMDPDVPKTKKMSPDLGAFLTDVLVRKYGPKDASPATVNPDQWIRGHIPELEDYMRISDPRRYPGSRPSWNRNDQTVPGFLKKIGINITKGYIAQKYVLLYNEVKARKEAELDV